MKTDEKARLLLDYVERKNDFVILRELDYGPYNHIGAIATAAILQSGLNWKNTVKPKVDNICSRFSESRTTSAFLELFEKLGYSEILNWNHEEKPKRILELLCFLKSRHIETKQDLREWLLVEENPAKLLKLRGIKRKTADFLKMLVDIPTNAVDRHLVSFLNQAGLDAVTYDERHEIIDRAADLAGYDRKIFDFSIWQYMSSKSEGRRRKIPSPCKSQAD